MSAADVGDRSIMFLIMGIGDWGRGGDSGERGRGMSCREMGILPVKKKEEEKL